MRTLGRQGSLHVRARFYEYVRKHVSKQYIISTRIHVPSIGPRALCSLGSLLVETSSEYLDLAGPPDLRQDGVPAAVHPGRSKIDRLLRRAGGVVLFLRLVVRVRLSVLEETPDVRRKLFFLGKFCASIAKLHYCEKQL